MEQLGFFDIPSPCLGICKTDNRGYCLGCMRSRDERFHWQQFTDAQKLEVIRLCKRRRRSRQLALLKAQKAHLQQQRNELNGSLDFGETDE
ncbi:MAG: DUF1289 domain-containing protein [Shewanella sp.]|nr:DUF1289 domain-containing protein [Shewanella sp.]MCF1430941.1 DUF1289 domain-containing protein [Shewanella sp.]MCF1439968.1 DUF1289 domain-containing protein [Shewanella sp.]MCF1458139.1 DUF1289 domain-containing protein [Shewanella sp.]